MKKIFITLLTVIIVHSLNAQKIPLGYCGIQYTYDNAGNQIKREYVCNNGLWAGGANESSALQIIDVLSPNPTTGKFSVTFTKALNKADIVIADATGRMVLQMKGNGNKIDFDISTLAAGIYFLRIKEDGRVFEAKVIKQ